MRKNDDTFHGRHTRPGPNKMKKLADNGSNQILYFGSLDLKCQSEVLNNKTRNTLQTQTASEAWILHTRFDRLKDSDRNNIDSHGRTHMKESSESVDISGQDKLVSVN